MWLKKRLEKRRTKHRLEEAQKFVEEHKNKMASKTVCDVLGHDWLISARTFYESNVIEIKKQCKRCGKTKERIKPL